MPSIEMSQTVEEVKRLQTEFREEAKAFKPDASGLPADVVIGRKMYSLIGNKLVPDADVLFEKVELGGVPAELVWVEGASHEHVILFLHGGAWQMGSAPEYRQMAGRLSQASNACVFVLEYRLAPENVYPAALNDVFAAYQGLLAGGRIAKKISLGGSSAGSALSIGALLMAREAGLPMPASLFQVSPAADLVANGSIFNDPNFPDIILSPEVLKGVYRRYLNGHDPADPLVSPVYADLTELPPMYIEVGSQERLIEDAQLLTARAKECGVNTTLYVCDGAIHAFPFFAGNTPEASECMNRIGHHIRNCF